MNSGHTASVLLSVLLLCGCANLTPTQQRVLAVSASLIVVGAIYAYQQHDGHGAHAPTPHCPHGAFDCRPVK